MAQTTYIPIVDDNEILSASPLYILDTDYYEMWYRANGDQQWTQLTAASPLLTFDLGSPAGIVPCMVIDPLPNTAAFTYQVRRFDHDGNFSKWSVGTFTTP